MSTLTKKRGVSMSTISRAHSINLGFKSYALKVKHLLTEQQEEVRLVRCKTTLNSLKSTGECICFFSDENIVTVDRTINCLNDRWISLDPKDVPASFRMKNPASVMVLGVISTNGDVMFPHFFKKGEAVNKVYLEVLKTVVIPWMNGVANGARYTFQQYSMPLHGAITVQVFLQENTPHFWAKRLSPPTHLIQFL